MFAAEKKVKSTFLRFTLISRWYTLTTQTDTQLCASHRPLLKRTADSSQHFPRSLLSDSSPAPEGQTPELLINMFRYELVSTAFTADDTYKPTHTQQGSEVNSVFTVSYGDFMSLSLCLNHLYVFNCTRQTACAHTQTHTLSAGCLCPFWHNQVQSMNRICFFCRQNHLGLNLNQDQSLTFRPDTRPQVFLLKVVLLEHKLVHTAPLCEYERCSV